MTDPREFGCMDDATENNGWGWYRWPEPRERTPYLEAEEEFIDEEPQYEQEKEDGWQEQ